MTINIILSAILLISTICFAILIFYSWRKRNSPIAISYGLGVVVASLYTLGYAFQLTSQSIEQAMLWIRVQYIGIPFASLLWVVLILQFIGKQNVLTKRNISFMIVAPLFTLISNYTNDWHHLFYKSVNADYSRGFFLLILDRGPLFYLHIFITYSYFLVGLYLVIRHYAKASQEMKKQIKLMVIGSFFIFGAPLAHSLKIIDTPFDISPFGFIGAGLFYLWGINRFNILNLSPIVMNKVFDSVYDAIIIFNCDNTINTYNKAATNLFISLKSNNLVGEKATEHLSEYPVLLDIIEQNTSQSVAIRTIVKLGERHYNVQSSLINGRKNKLVGKMIILHDITESILYEQSLIQQSKQLAELNSFRDNMFRIVAHDIRDPLAVLVNLMEIMDEDLKETELLTQTGGTSEIIDEMRKQINNTFFLVDSLLEWFHTQRGGMLFNPVERDLNKVIQSTLDMMQVKISSKQIRISSVVSENIYVYVDKDMLELIVRNLLSNAIKFTSIGGSIRLSSNVHQNFVVVAVSDTGQGISKEDANSILQGEFLTSKRGTAGEQGIGLGLSICREFVRLNGGEIWFDSSIGVGTTFYFSLPLATKGRFFKTDVKEEVV